LQIYNILFLFFISDFENLVIWVKERERERERERDFYYIKNIKKVMSAIFLHFFVFLLFRSRIHNQQLRKLHDIEFWLKIFKYLCSPCWIRHSFFSNFDFEFVISDLENFTFRINWKTLLYFDQLFGMSGSHTVYRFNCESRTWRSDTQNINCVFCSFVCSLYTYILYNWNINSLIFYYKTGYKYFQIIHK